MGKKPPKKPPRYINEIRQLNTLKNLLERDKTLPIRIDLEFENLARTIFKITINGITSLIANPLNNNSTANKFLIRVKVATDPFREIPIITFLDPIPFHPHIYTNGSICWGTLNTPQPDKVLLDWLYNIIEYLLYTDTLLIINVNSPANREAVELWQNNRNKILENVSKINMERLRYLIQIARG